MARHANSVTGYNASDNVIPSCSAVVIGQRMNASGISDDMCFEVYAKNFSPEKIIGVTTCDLYPGMAGKIIISGITEAKLADFFDTGDSIFPDENGVWSLNESGIATVITPGQNNEPAVIFLRGIGSTSNQLAYNGQFRIKDFSEDNIMKILAYGGNTDKGFVEGKFFTLTSSVVVYLMIEYIHTDDDDGYYVQKLTTDYEKDRTSDEYALWLIGNVSFRSGKDGKNYLQITQEWQSGEIYWSSRFWI